MLSIARAGGSFDIRLLRHTITQRMILDVLQGARALARQNVQNQLSGLAPHFAQELGQMPSVAPPVTLVHAPRPAMPPVGMSHA